MKILRRTIVSQRRAFTLIEVSISLAIAGIAVAGIVGGYLQAAKRAEWSAYSLAAHSLAIQRLEQTRAAQWDPMMSIDQLVAARFPTTNAPLDIPRSGTNIVYATITTSVTSVSTNPSLKKIAVQCVWPFPGRGSFTNKVTTYRAPVQ